jgi:hypothetical protein
LSARSKIKTFLLENIGRVVRTSELQEVAGIGDYGRRIRELREKDGLQILTHKDRRDLRPGEYLLESTEILPRMPIITPTVRMAVLERDGFSCQLCGAAAGSPDPCQPGKLIRLILAEDERCSVKCDGAGRYRTLCSACNRGVPLSPISKDAIQLLKEIRSAPLDTQREIFSRLRDRFLPSDQLDL